MDSVWVFVQQVKDRAPRVDAFRSESAARQVVYQWARVNWPHSRDDFPADVDEALRLMHHLRKDIRFSLMELPFTA